MIIVGSTALKHFGLNRQEPKDLDIWNTITQVFTNAEVSTDVFVVSQEIYNLVPTDGYYATPDAVYTIKCSHFMYDIKWDKTKKDILWLKHKGCKLIPELHQALKKVWEKEYGDKSFLSLSKDKESFFNDHVSYIYDHDYLHKLVAHPNLPIYTRCLRDNHEVFISKKRFLAMPFEDQLQLFKEEITVIAIERWVIPKIANWHTAYGLALKRTITNLTKNWATDFIIANLAYYSKPEYVLFKRPFEILKLHTKGIQTMDAIQNIIKELYTELNTNESIEEFIFNLCESDIDYFSEKGSRVFDDKFMNRTKKILNDWGYKHIQTTGGGEGGEENCTGIFELKGITLRACYNYYSHHGYDYDDILYTLEKVTPVVKKVTVYE